MKLAINSSILTLLCLTIACTKETPKPDPVVIDPVVPKPYELPLPATCGYTLTAADTQGWKEVWSDEFDGNLDKWTPWTSGAYNEELQLYKPENLILKNGFLYIWSKRESTFGKENPTAPNTKNFRYTSGRIESKSTFGPGGGKPVKIMAKIQLSKGDGLWPAFWTYNDPWPTAGEIDILENRGHNVNEFETTYHYGSRDGQLQTNSNLNSVKYTVQTGKPNLSECFYVYEMEWYADKIIVKLNGEVYSTFQQPKNAYINALGDKKHRVILNMAVGGLFFTNLNEGLIPANAAMIVDWVKVFEKGEG